MDQDRAECLAERGADPDAPRAKGKANGGARQTAQDARRQAAEWRTALAPLRKNVTRAEAAVELLAKRIAAIDRDLADVDSSTVGDRIGATAETLRASSSLHDLGYRRIWTHPRENADGSGNDRAAA
jgi:chromosome segregation ATPase